MPEGGRVHVPAVSLLVRWDWEYDTNKYWLSHESFNPVSGERFDKQSHAFRWKAVDATGDCALAVRWVHAARALLTPSGAGTNRVR